MRAVPRAAYDTQPRRRSGTPRSPERSDAGVEA